MRDWIVGLQKAAVEVRGGASDVEWERARRKLEQDEPAELHDLYNQLNGARFASGVVLFPLRGAGRSRGVVELSHSGEAGFPAQGVWRFGIRNHEHLAAVRKRRLGEVEQGGTFEPPAWLQGLSDEDWVFIARDEAANAIKPYRTLEQLLTARVPPAHAEEFGERTYAHAMMLVEGALTELSASSQDAVKSVLDQVRRSTRAAGAKKKAAPAKKRTAAGAKKKAAPAKKRTAAGAKKKAAPAKKRAAAGAKKKAAPAKKKPAAKRASPKRAAPRKKGGAGRRK